MGRAVRGRAWPLAQRDPHGGHSKHRRCALLDLLEALVDGCPSQQVGCDVGEEGRLALALLGIRSACAVARRETPDDDGRDHVHGERQPVAAVRKRERVQRREEEEVEREHARDGDRDRNNRSPEDRYEQDGEDVEHAEAEDRHEVVEELDRHRHGSDGKQPGYSPDEPVTRRLRARVHRKRSVRLWSERCCSAGGRGGTAGRCGAPATRRSWSAARRPILRVEAVS